MGQKLSAEQIDQYIIDNPMEGFDHCAYCDGIEPQDEMLSFDDSDVLICEECNTEKFKEIEDRLTENIDDVFVLAHKLFGTNSGDISPSQTVQLDSLKEQLFDLILEQVKQNLQ
jgi:hypothetical protein